MSLADDFKYASSIESIKHYICMMLADDLYNPHVDTMRHLDKIINMCDEALADIKKRAPDIVDNLISLYDRKIIVSCTIASKYGSNMYSSGVAIDLLAPSKQYTMGRLTPGATDPIQVYYDSIYEGLSYFTTWQGAARDAISIQICCDNERVINNLIYNLEESDENLEKRRKSVNKTIEATRKLLLIPIYLTWYPANTTAGMRAAKRAANQQFDPYRP